MGSDLSSWSQEMEEADPDGCGCKSQGGSEIGSRCGKSPVLHVGLLLDWHIPRLRSLGQAHRFREYEENTSSMRLHICDEAKQPVTNQFLWKRY
jgi:hypothetical protein